MLKPRVVISACLLGEKVRYDGRDALSDRVMKIARSCDVLMVCPEVSLGLGVPRDKIILYVNDNEKRAVKSSDGRELAEEIKRFSTDFLSKLGDIDGFILKSKSPSCGISGTKTYSDAKGERLVARGSGIFGDEVLKRFGYLPIEEEHTLEDKDRRLRFLAGLWLFFRVRTEGQVRVGGFTVSRRRDLRNSLKSIDTKTLIPVVMNSPFRDCL